MKVKICSRHAENFPDESATFPATTEYFYRAGRNRDGLKGICKRCAEKKTNEYLKENPKRHKRKHNEANQRLKKNQKAQEGFKIITVACHNADAGCKNEALKQLPEDVINYRWICAECQDYGSPEHRNELSADDSVWSDGASVEKLNAIHAENVGCVTLKPGDEGFDELEKLYGGGPSTAKDVGDGEYSRQTEALKAAMSRAAKTT